MRREETGIYHHRSKLLCVCLVHLVPRGLIIDTQTYGPSLSESESEGS